jgi:iron complex outermembrane receptor protein
VVINRRFVESGGRLFSQNTDTYRMVAGFDGELDNGIRWDLSYVFADNQETYETNFYGRFDRWATIVDPDLCAADPACVAAAGDDGVLNPFSDYGGITPAEMAYLSANSLKDVYETHMTSLTLNVSGEFGALQGGAVGWAAGVEQRSERARIIPDEFSSGGLTTSGATDPLDGSYEVREAYAEFLLPLLADVAFAKSLDIEASARYSDYNTAADDTDNYRVGADWAINDEIRARAVYATGFRAPNMVEYFTQAVTFPISENWCEFTDLRNDINDVAKANCAALGYDGLYEYGIQHQPTYSQTAAAGDALAPEESTTWTAGVVWQPAFAEGLEISVDWYQIEIDEYIGLPDYNFLVKTCLESVGFSAPACGAMDPLDSSGVDQGQTGVHPFASDGTTQNAITPLGNLGELETSGIDFGVGYSMNVEWGFITLLTMGLDASYLDTYEISFPLTGSYELVGTAGYAGTGGTAVYPEWRFNTSVGVGTEMWTVAWNMRWLDESEDLYRPSSITNDAVAEDVLYHDLVVTVDWNNVSFVAGVDNVADEEPPLFHSGFNMDTATGFYDTLGRKAWMGVKVSL